MHCNPSDLQTHLALNEKRGESVELGALSWRLMLSPQRHGATGLMPGSPCLGLWSLDSRPSIVQFRFAVHER